MPAGRGTDIGKTLGWVDACPQPVRLPVEMGPEPSAPIANFWLGCRIQESIVQDGGPRNCAPSRVPHCPGIEGS